MALSLCACGRLVGVVVVCMRGYGPVLGLGVRIAQPSRVGTRGAHRGPPAIPGEEVSQSIINQSHNLIREAAREDTVTRGQA